MNGSILFKSGVRLLAVSSGVAYDAHSWTTDEGNYPKHVPEFRSCCGVCDVHGAPRSSSSPRWSALDSGSRRELRKYEAVKSAVAKCRDMVEHVRIKQGAPGASVAIAVDGKIVCREGLGYADVENAVACTEETVMRIASISKPLVAVAVMQLWEDGMLDLDSPVQTYVPHFPVKKFAGKAVQVSSRQLLSHLGGIRHYSKLPPAEDTVEEFEHPEYYIKEHYKSVDEAVRLFAQDDLLAEPG